MPLWEIRQDLEENRDNPEVLRKLIDQLEEYDSAGAFELRKSVEIALQLCQRARNNGQAIKEYVPLIHQAASSPSDRIHSDDGTLHADKKDKPLMGDASQSYKPAPSSSSNDPSGAIISNKGFESPIKFKLISIEMKPMFRSGEFSFTFYFSISNRHSEIIYLRMKEIYMVNYMKYISPCIYYEGLFKGVRILPVTEYNLSFKFFGLANTTIYSDDCIRLGLSLGTSETNYIWNVDLSYFILKNTQSTSLCQRSQVGQSGAVSFGRKIVEEAPSNSDLIPSREQGNARNKDAELKKSIVQCEGEYKLSAGKWALLPLDETSYYCDDKLHKITGKVLTVYIYNKNDVSCYCALPAYWLWPIGCICAKKLKSDLVFDFLSSAVNEVGGLYMNCSEVDAITPRVKGLGRVRATLHLNVDTAFAFYQDYMSGVPEFIPVPKLPD